MTNLGEPRFSKRNILFQAPQIQQFSQRTREVGCGFIDDHPAILHALAVGKAGKTKNEMVTGFHNGPQRFIFFIIFAAWK